MDSARFQPKKLEVHPGGLGMSNNGCLLADLILLMHLYRGGAAYTEMARTLNLPNSAVDLLTRHGFNDDVSVNVRYVYDIAILTNGLYRF